MFEYQLTTKPFLHITELHQYSQLPSKEELTNPRGNLKDFTVFCDNFLNCTHGKKAFKDNVKDKRVSRFTSITTEAYTIAYLVNSYDNWLCEAEDPENDKVKRRENKKTYGMKLWTNEAHAANLYGGWKEAGLAYYIDKACDIQEDRKEEKHNALEDDYIKIAEKTYGRPVRAPKSVALETNLVNVLYDDNETDEEEENEQEAYEEDDNEENRYGSGYN